MNTSSATHVIIGSFIILFATVLIPFGPTFGGIYVGYIEGSNRRRGLRLICLTGLCGFGIVTLVASQFTGYFFYLVYLTAGFSGLEGILIGWFLYIVVLSTVGGYIGAVIQNTYGTSKLSQQLDQESE